MNKLSKTQNIAFVLIFFIAMAVGLICGYELGKNNIDDKLNEHGYTLYEDGVLIVEVSGGRHYSIESNAAQRSLPSGGCWFDETNGVLWVKNETQYTAILNATEKWRGNLSDVYTESEMKRE